MFAKVNQSPTEAAKSAQTLLNLLNPANRIAVDGVIGDQTRAAFSQLGGEARGLVTSLAKARNDAVIAGLTEVPRMGSSEVWISRDEARTLIREAVRRFGQLDLSGSSTEDYLLWKLDLEASKQRRSDGVYYSASHRNRFGYVGLYQVGKAAYEDVARSGRIPSLPVFSVAAADPWLNTAMALVYSQLCVATLRSGLVKPRVAPYKGAVTKEVLYGVYNQGVAGFMTGAKNALQEGGQSAHATPIIASALQFVRSQQA